MNCTNPKCGSDDTKTARMVYLTSTTITTTRGTSSSLSLASGGATIGGGTSHSKSKAQLMLALEEEIQPPKPPPSEPVFLFTGFGVSAFLALALMAAMKLQDGSWFLWFFVPIAVMLGFLFQRGAWAAWDKHRDNVELYNRKWICLRCGHVWYAEN